MRRIALAMRASSTGHGPYHPSIRSLMGGHEWYWPNITMPSEDEAAAFAQKALQDAENAAEAIAQQWNITEV